MTEYTKWAEPVTYGSSKFEVMTDELHARPVAVVNTLDDARLIAAAPGMLAALNQLQYAYRQIAGLHDPNTDDAFTVIAHNAIAKAKGA